MKQRSNMPAAKLLIEFYFLRRAAFPCVHGHKASNMGWGLCDRLCVDTRTGCGLVERASASPCRHSLSLSFPPVYSPIREEARVSNTADYSRSSRPSLLFHGFSG